MVNPIITGGYVVSSQTWNYLLNGAGSLSPANINGGALRSTTGANNGDDNTIYTGATFAFNPDNHPWLCLGLDPDTVTQHDLVGGLFQDANNYIEVYSSNGGNIQCECKAGVGNVTTVDSGVAQTANKFYFMIEVIDDGSVNFYYSLTHWRDMTFITNISTNVPAGQFEPYFNHETTENVAKQVDVIKLCLCQEAV